MDSHQQGADQDPAILAEQPNPAQGSDEAEVNGKTRNQPSGWRALPAKAIIFPVRLYQRFISPLLGPWCRFTPTCSSYFIQAVEKHGVVRGSIKGIWRICRCHPFGGSGHDPP